MPAAQQPALSDDVLLRQSAAGIPTAFDELVRRHQAGVYRFVITLGLVPADAEDALQETFISAWRGAGGFAGTGSVRSWLLSIARNAVRHQQRRGVGEPDALESIEDLALRAGWGEPSAPSIDDDADGAEELIRRGVERLRDDERAVLTLREIEGFSGEETARLLELTIPAMKSRLHRARLHLAAVVKEEMNART